MTKKDVENIRTSTSTICASEVDDISPNNKKRHIKKESDNNDINIENYKKKLEEHKDILHESMTKFLNSLYEELENSRINLESSCLRSLQKYGDSIRRFESLKNQNMESSLRLQKMQNMIKKFTDKMSGV